MRPASNGALARAGPAALAGLLWLGCGHSDDLAALVVSSAPQDGTFDASEPFAVIGLPWRGAGPQPSVEWPLATPLAEFFAGPPADGGRRVMVPEADREALWTLRASVVAGEYGESRASVVVVDDRGDAYMILFPGDE